MIVKQFSCSSVDVLVIDEQHHAFRHSVLKTLKAKKARQFEPLRTRTAGKFEPSLSLKSGL